MVDDLTLTTKPKLRLTFEQFEVFRDARPRLEKWELIDGELVMMPPPAVLHQRIAKNIARLLDERLSVTQPTWTADQEIGVHIPEDDDFCPEPDVTVTDREIPINWVYAQRFYFVVEVISKDRADVLAKKRAYYQAHNACRGYMFVTSKAVGAEMVIRTSDEWVTRTVSDPDTVIDIPDIGPIGTLRQFYRDTGLDGA